MNQPFMGCYPITQYFGDTITNPQGHTGIDYALFLGTPVLAVMDGVVSQVQLLKDGYGRHIVLDHADNLQTLYAHLLWCDVKPGDAVYDGQVIGLSGNSGNSTGAHLHFEVRRNGTAIDPQMLLAEPTSCVDETDSWQVCVDCLNVRSGPGNTYPVIDRLARGSRVAEHNCSLQLWIQIGEGRWVAATFENEELMREVNHDQTA